MEMINEILKEYNDCNEFVKRDIKRWAEEYYKENKDYYSESDLKIAIKKYVDYMLSEEIKKWNWWWCR